MSNMKRVVNGALLLATSIKVRMAAMEESVWTQPSTTQLVPPDPSIRRAALSKLLLEGRVVHKDVLQEVYDDINKRFGSNVKLPE